MARILISREPDEWNQWYFAPKGPRSVAQGNALGEPEQKKFAALKGRYSRRRLPRAVPPFQGSWMDDLIFPGRCPGLCCTGPSGRMNFAYRCPSLRIEVGCTATPSDYSRSTLSQLRPAAAPGNPWSQVLRFRPWRPYNSLVVRLLPIFARCVRAAGGNFSCAVSRDVTTRTK